MEIISRGRSLKMFDNPKRFTTFVEAKILKSTEYGKFT